MFSPPQSMQNPSSNKQKYPFAKAYKKNHLRTNHNKKVTIKFGDIENNCTFALAKAKKDNKTFIWCVSSAG